MSLPQPKIPFGPDDYLAWEQGQSGRNEYVDGKVFAKSGASDAHGTAALNLAALLRYCVIALLRYCVIALLRYCVPRCAANPASPSSPT